MLTATGNIIFSEVYLKLTEILVYTIHQLKKTE